MLSLVPDPEPSSAPESKAAGGKATHKVELDLEDAPFLDEPDPPAPVAAPEVSQPSEAVAAPADIPAKKNRLQALLAKLKALLAVVKANKKKSILVGGGAGLLLVIGIVVKIVLFSGPSAPPPEPAPLPVATPEPRKIVVPSAPPPEPAAPPPAAHLLKLEPFWVPRRGTEGEIRFLHCQFTIPTNNPSLFTELNVKQITLRDALYYYLQNASLDVLDTETKAKTLRDDLIQVINEHVAVEKVTDLYIESYLITTP